MSVVNYEKSFSKQSQCLWGLKRARAEMIINNCIINYDQSNWFGAKVSSKFVNVKCAILAIFGLFSGFFNLIQRGFGLFTVLLTWLWSWLNWWVGRALNITVQKYLIKLHYLLHS